MGDQEKLPVPLGSAVSDHMDVSGAHLVLNQPDGNHSETVVVHDHIADCLRSICFAGKFYMDAAALEGPLKQVSGSAAWFPLQISHNLSASGTVTILPFFNNFSSLFYYLFFHFENDII